jgi:hypothetical protein
VSFNYNNKKRNTMKDKIPVVPKEKLKRLNEGIDPNYVFLSNVIACVHPFYEIVSGDEGDFCCKCQKYLRSHRL